MRSIEGYYLITDIKKATQWPRFAEGLFAGMLRLNSNMEEVIRMMKELKDAEGFVDVDEAVMCRTLDNFKEILDLTCKKKVEK